MTLAMPRRRFLAGLIGLVAAPAVVHAASLMPVRALAAAPGMTAPEVVERFGLFPGGVSFVDLEFSMAMMINPPLLGVQ